MILQIIRTPPSLAALNMQRDGDLLEALADLPTLHLYDWAGPALTYGHFADPTTLLNLDAVATRGIDHAKRPTGGGITLHTHDLAFSFLYPSSAKNYPEEPLAAYRWVNSLVRQALALIDDKWAHATQMQETTAASAPLTTRYCLSHASPYDLLWEGKKLVGAAQRRKRQGFLHQGSIHIQMPPQSLLEAIIPHAEIRQSIQKTSVALNDTNCPNFLKTARKNIQEALIQAFTQAIESTM